MLYLSNGPSFSGGQATSNGQSALCGERRNTETWIWRLQCQIQPGAVS